MFCNICGERSFEAYNNRPNARCDSCGSMERHRVFALFMMELFPTLKGNPIHALKNGNLQLLGRTRGPLVFSSPVELRATGVIHALMLFNEFSAFGCAPSEVFAGMRRKMPIGGVIAFKESPTLKSTENSAKLPLERTLLGISTKIPGWSISAWRPEYVFGKYASQNLSLGYPSGKDDPNQLLVATVV